MEKLMPRWKVRTIWAVAIVAVLVFVVPVVFTLDPLVPRISERLQAKTGFSLSVGGSLYFRLFPQPKLVAEEVRLSNQADTTPLLTADVVSIRPSLLSLLLGRLVLDEVIVLRPVVRLSYDASGRPNWRASKKKTAFAPDVPLMYAREGWSFMAAHAAEPVAPVGTMQQFHEKVRLPSYLPIRKLKIAYGNLTAFGETDENSQALGRIMLEFAADSMDAPVALRASADWHKSLQQLEVSIPALPTLLTDQGGQFHGRLDGSLGAYTFDGGFALGPNRRFAQLQVRSGDGVGPAHPIQLLVGADHDTLSVRQCAVDFGDALAGNCSVSIDMSGPRPTVSVSVDVDHVNLNKFSYELNEWEDPQSMSQFLAGFPSADVFRNQKQIQWKDKPISLDSLYKADTDLTIGITSAFVHGTHVGPVHIRAQTKEGSLMSRVQGQVGPGRFALIGDVDADLTGSSLTADLWLSASDIPIDKYLVGNRGILKSGTLQVDVDLHTKGDTQKALISNLGGHLSLDFAEGEMRLYRLGRAWIASLAPVPDDCPPVVAQANLQAKADIADGIMQIERLTLAGEDIMVTADGVLDLPHGTFDLALRGGRTSCIPSTLISGPWSSPTIEPTRD